METKNPAARPRVLNVEDDPELQHLTSFALRDQGFEVYYAFTRPEGLEKAAALLPDLILLDLMLPHLSGPEVIKRLMSDPRRAASRSSSCPRTRASPTSSRAS